MNILHLSDIHFGRDNPIYGIPDNFKNHDQILSELIECIAGLDEFSKPEHVVFTGDIAWHGLAEEFAEAYEWFKQLLAALNLTGKDISFCVGNHDVDWCYRCLDINLNDNSENAINELYKYENIHKLEPSIYAYDNFCKHIGMVPYQYPVKDDKRYSYSVGYKDVDFECGKKVRFVALNSAMLIAQPGISEDKMWLGQEQIRTLVEYGILPADDKDEIAYSVVLYHHSDRFLHPNETSAYDGKCATLPLVQNYADLLLCGHTESTGRPRLVKQLGGGTLLSGGACYYNDDHFNAFSMIYLSEGKKGIGFFPFYYDKGWKDYDFMEHTLLKEKIYQIYQETEVMDDLVLTLFDDEESCRIDIEKVEIYRDGKGNINGFDNKYDFMNFFHIAADIDSEGNYTPFSISLSNDWEDFLEARYKYKKVFDFICSGDINSNFHWEITDKEQNVVFTGNERPVVQDYSFNVELQKKLSMIEFYFGVKFHVPSQLSLLDGRKISTLMDLANNDFTTKVYVSNHIREELTLEQMKSLKNLIKDKDEIYLKCKSKYLIELFGVRISFGDTHCLAGPYKVDVDDLNKKIDTYCEGDRRFISFIGTDKLHNYVITNFETFKEKQKEELLKEIFEVTPFKFDLEL